MGKVLSRLSLLCLLAGSFSGSASFAQTTAPTALDKQLARIDFGVAGFGEFTGSSSGTNYLKQPVSLRPSKTLGALVTLRYIKSPLVGLELNYTYARYTEDFKTQVTSPAGVVSPSALGIQTAADEYTLGYVVHAPVHAGFQPFASIGAGVMEFKPTPLGGEGFLPQARAAYYYSAGAESTFGSDHYGLRAEFRQVMFLAPDFGANYLTIKQRTLSTEPAIGFFVRF